MRVALSMALLLGALSGGCDRACTSPEHRDYGDPPFFDSAEGAFKLAIEREPEISDQADDYRREARGAIVIFHADDHYWEVYRDKGRWAVGAWQGCS